MLFAPVLQGRSIFVRQNYIAPNNGAWLAPRGYIPAGLAIAHATTPYLGRPMLTHSAPVTYTMPRNPALVRGNLSPMTPAGQGVQS